MKKNENVQIKKYWNYEFILKFNIFVYMYVYIYLLVDVNYISNSNIIK